MPGDDPARELRLEDLHPDTQSAHKLLTDGHNADAVRRATQRFINRVATLSDPEGDGSDDQLDGVPLVRAAFDQKTPLLAFNARVTRVERNEHDGYRNLAIGLVLALRNVVTHADEYDIDEREALEWLAFVSAMHRRLDRVNRVPRAAAAPEGAGP